LTGHASVSLESNFRWRLDGHSGSAARADVGPRRPTGDDVTAPLGAISRQIWQSKYRDRGAPETTISDTWRRVASSLAAVELKDRANWEQKFFDILEDFRFLPGGRIQAGAGTPHTVTLFNCFVMGTIEDSMTGIFRALEKAAVTMQYGGGIGCDFSPLRPRGTPARNVGAIASGPVSFMHLWDAMCATILSTGARRGAMMATLRCDHPDIEEFIAANQRPGQLRRFNLSVLVSDEFMAAVRQDSPWPLIFPAEAIASQGETMLSEWPGGSGPVPCRIVRSIRARHLWDRILRAGYDYAEPGVLFIDRINRLNNLWYAERISATNPCGEVPLPPYGACDLGSLNLTRFIDGPFTLQAQVDRTRLAESTRVAVRMLDNVIDASRFPLPQQARAARNSRRVGLGITGLADALLMLGIRYGDDRSFDVAADLMRPLCHAAYRASADLAREKGAFHQFDRDRYLAGAFVQGLPADIRAAIAQDGIRNSHLIAVAPTGTISLLAGAVSSGLEPIFASSYSRKMLGDDGRPTEFPLVDYAIGLWREGGHAGLPENFVTARDFPIETHLNMQAALQPFVDNSISKTINVPENCPFEEFAKTYDLAYDKGLKGCTTFRPNPVTGAVLREDPEGIEAPHCCVLERESD
jgi:ribonucleoside-diphosphate reductase alpha chain